MVTAMSYGTCLFGLGFPPGLTCQFGAVRCHVDPAYINPGIEGRVTSTPAPKVNASKLQLLGKSIYASWKNNQVSGSDGFPVEPAGKIKP